MKHIGSLILFALAVCADADAVAGTPAVSAQVQAGHRSFVAKGCWSCHGYSGQGSVMTGPRLFPGMTSPEAFRAMIRHPISQMPSYSPKILSDDEIANIREYLASLPQPRSAQGIALLNKSGSSLSKDGRSSN